MEVSSCLCRVVFVVLFGVTYGADLSKLTDKELHKHAGKYFERYGYADSDTFRTDTSVKVAAITRFQYFANITVTGTLDQETMNKMDEDRCGKSDPHVTVPESALQNVAGGLKIHLKPKSRSRVRRYTHQGSTWKKSKLTWRLMNMPQGDTELTAHQIRYTMTKATHTWMKYSNMEFEEISAGEPDVEVKFGDWEHGDPYPFDGPGGTLAHAYYPHNNKGLAGDVHLDDDEMFTVDTWRGVNLDWVMTHELGHTLGLEHSRSDKAVMYPWYQPYKPGGFDLNYDDIVGIQTLYGGKVRKKKTTAAPRTTKPPPTTTTPTTTTTTTKAPPTTRPPPTTPKRKKARRCPALPINAILDLPRIRHRFFIAGGGEQLYFFKRNSIQYGPLRTRNYFPKSRIPGYMDAAFTMTSGRNGGHITVIFSGRSYYIYRLFGFKSGPHSYHAKSSNNPLNFQFPRWVQKVDAAMRWHRNEKIYLFAEDSFWKYDDESVEFFPGYPRNTLSSWRGVPRNIDSAFSSKADKRTFFISGDQFYLINDMTVSVERGYPQYIGDAWLNCD